MELSKEQLNFLVRLNVKGPLTYDFLGDTLDIEKCDEEAKKQCKMMEKLDLIYEKGYGYHLTDKGLQLIKNIT